MSQTTDADHPAVLRPYETTEAERAALPEYAKRLVAAFRDEFGGRIEAERTGTGDRCRFAVISPKFEEMETFDCQDAVWDVADRVLGREEVVQITLIFTYAPSELNEDGEVIGEYQ